MSREIICGLWITEHRKGGKMANKDSIMFCHPSFCDRTCGVCGACYSKKMSSYRQCLAEKQEQNTRIMKSPYFKPCKLHTIDGSIRWSSTGELLNKQTYDNICKMADHNDHLVHALWTKRPGLVLWKEKPENMTLVWSATKIDYPDPFIPAGFDIGFFVYSSYDRIPTDRHTIHCRKKCEECNFCYEPGARGIVCEVLK